MLVQSIKRQILSTTLSIVHTIIDMTQGFIASGGAMEEHLKRALIELYFAIAEFERLQSLTLWQGDRQQAQAMTAALQAARTALESSADWSNEFGLTCSENDSAAPPLGRN